MKRPNDFTKLDPTGAARNGKSSNGLDSVLLIDGQTLLYTLHGYSAASLDRYVQLHDAARLPGNGSRPLRVWMVSTGQTIDFEIVNGRPFNEGICIAISSTSDQLTYTNANEFILDCSFSEL